MALCNRLKVLCGPWAALSLTVNFIDPSQRRSRIYKIPAIDLEFLSGRREWPVSFTPETALIAGFVEPWGFLSPVSPSLPSPSTSPSSFLLDNEKFILSFHFDCLFY